MTPEMISNLADAREHWQVLENMPTEKLYQPEGQDLALVMASTDVPNLLAIIDAAKGETK